MSLAELVILSVKVEGRSKSEVARDYKISRYWVQQLVKRYEAEGTAAFEARSRRPHSNPRSISLDLEDRIIRLRKDLSKKGLDAGAETIRCHLQAEGASRLPATSTIWRVLTRRGFVTPQPRKRPKGAGKRFAAEQPNERWQADVTHWQLADGTGAEIHNILDDHSRLNLSSQARPSTTGPDVLIDFRRTFRRHGIPASVLTDNGAIFTGKPRRGGRVALEIELDLLGVRLHHCRPYHPPNLRKGRAVPPDTEEVARRPTRAGHHRRPATPARPVPALLQHHPPAPRDRPTHPRTRLHRPPEGPSRQTPDPGPLPGPPRQDRPRRGHRAALPQPAAPHRPGPRTRPQTHPGPRRRPLPPRRRRRDRRTPPRTHHRPKPRLPTHRSAQRTHPTTPEMTTTEPPTEGPAVSDVLTHHTARPEGFEPPTF